MTRKQALYKSIELLSRDPENAEIIEKLQECIYELPFAKWTEKAIFDACNQFIEENNRVPNARDFDSTGLPSHPVIKNRFGLTIKEFREKYYLDGIVYYKSPYWRKTNKEWIEIFIEEYNRVKPTSAIQYNNLKDKDNPTWSTICKMAGVNSWVELKRTLNLNTYKHPRFENSNTYKVSITIPK